MLYLSPILYNNGQKFKITHKEENQRYCILRTCCYDVSEQIDLIVRHVALKREQIFKPVEDARLARLAQAQADAAKKPSVGDFMEEEKEVAASSTADADAMTEEEPKKKISTSGPRSNRHARKLKEKKKKGKKSAIKF